MGSASFGAGLDPVHTTTATAVQSSQTAVQSGFRSIGPSLWTGTGVPPNSLGQDGHYCFRTDTPGTVNQRVYVRTGGTWSAIL